MISAMHAWHKVGARNKNREAGDSSDQPAAAFPPINVY